VLAKIEASFSPALKILKQSNTYAGNKYFTHLICKDFRHLVRRKNGFALQKRYINLLITMS
jgi:hypothetical protein